MPDEETLRTAFATTVANGDAHVEEDSWVRFSCNEMSAEERERTLDHASRCPECGRALRAVLLLSREARRFDADAPVRSRPGQGSFHWSAGRLGAAAAAAMALAAAVLWTALPRALVERPDTIPVPVSVPDALRSVDTERPTPVEPIGTMEKPPSGFTWRALDGARSYRIELMDGSGETIWVSEPVPGTFASWPSAIVPGSGRYYWRVVAIAMTGSSADVASPLVAFDLDPSAVK